MDGNTNRSAIFRFYHGAKGWLLIAATLGVSVFPILSNAIVGGVDAPDDRFPFMTTIQFKDSGATPLERHGCGASLISPTWVLTAAHCVIDTEPSDIEVVVGRTQLSNLHQGQSVAVKTIVSHPNFAQATVYDIALLQLEHAVTAVTPINRVASAERLEDSEKTVTAAGWGDTALPASSDRLQQASMPRISDAECTAFNPSLNPDTSFCIGVLAAGGPFPNNGDSGGPVFINQPGTGFIQLGVVSQAVVIVRLSNPEVAQFVNDTVKPDDGWKSNFNLVVACLMGLVVIIWLTVARSLKRNRVG